MAALVVPFFAFAVIAGVLFILVRANASRQENEKKGRRQTSTITVAVLPVPKASALEIATSNLFARV